MPEIGFDDVPIMPTMRELTVTKKKPKTTTNSPISSLPRIPPPLGSWGRTATMRTSASEPRITYVIGMSRSVRAGGHSAGANITDIGAIEPFGMRMTGDPTVAEAELFKIGKDGRVRNVG